MKLPIEMFGECLTKSAQNYSQEEQDAYGVPPSWSEFYQKQKDNMPSNLPLAALITALAGGTFLSHQGIKHLMGMKPAGGFKDTLEKGLLAHNALSHQGAANILAGDLQKAKDSLSNRNLALGLGGAYLAYPHIAGTAKDALTYDGPELTLENQKRKAS
jgi:hypothetical protein